MDLARELVAAITFDIVVQIQGPTLSEYVHRQNRAFIKTNACGSHVVGLALLARISTPMQHFSGWNVLHPAAIRIVAAEK
jgi:hypothetical protein